MKIAIVVAEFNQKITSRMYDVALETAKKLNVDVVHTSNVTGIFDMPLIIDKLLQRKDIDAVVTL
ncbi:MAG: 6,7-dimethyl-8-ribityllumazine synthase, partial [Thaumarchaeota archaeon]|nr:6,7-dimethyl-8-ribityllumazine synthase [Nitrososphaerota archaeon]